ncbi:hypothetical protein GF356_08420 [candidate division GN15 bacterium]|nr:hypothetical protein [candidate division GN15 bacterium]
MTRHNSVKTITVRVMLMGLLALVMLVIGCGDDGTPTDSTVGPPTDWPVYLMVGWGEETVLRYWPVANTVDTLSVPVPTTAAPGISPDGSLLYLPSDSQLVVIAPDDPQTVLQSVDSSCFGLGPVVSPDGAYILSENGVPRIGWDPEPHDVLFLDPSLNMVHAANNVSNFGDVSFSADGSRAYHISGELSNDIRVYDLSSTPELINTYTIDTGAPYFVEAIPGTSRLLLNLRIHAQTFVMAVYDMDSDSIVFMDDRSLDVAFDAVAKHDGTQAYYSIHPSTVVEYDVASNTIAREISTESAFGLVPTSFVARSIEITPDDRLLLLQSDARVTATGMLTFDLAANRFIGFQYLPYGVGRMTVQSGM